MSSLWAAAENVGRLSKTVGELAQTTAELGTVLAALTQRVQKLAQARSERRLEEPAARVEPWPRPRRKPRSGSAGWMTWRSRDLSRRPNATG